MYTKTNWVARVGTALNRFLKTNEDSPSGTVELTNDPTGVTTAGTPFTVANMNKIEQGIYDAHVTADANASNLLANVNQGVKTTDSPEFASVSTTGNASVVGDLGVTGALSGASINTGGLGAFLIGQNLRTTDNVNFANINPPVDNNDISPPAIGIGGFTYAVGIGNVGLTLPSGGTYVVLALPTSSGSASIARLSGGTSKPFISSSEDVGYLIMRIA